MSALYRIRNFERFQHYADRRPPWIKLYRDLWDDPRFFSLSERDRYVLISLFVVASQQDNKIPNNQQWLKAKLMTKSSIPLENLVAAGWLEAMEQDASKVLAVENASTPLSERYPSRARGETETDIQRQNTETEGEREPRKRGKTQAPDSLPLTSDLQTFAFNHGVFDLEEQAAAMLDHFRAKGEARDDWVATLRNWIRRSGKFSQNGGSNGKSKSQQREERLNRAAREALDSVATPPLRDVHTKGS